MASHLHTEEVVDGVEGSCWVDLEREREEN